VTRLAILSTLLLLLAGCALPSGKRVYLVTEEMYFGLYRAGAVDACMYEAREQMKRAGVPLTTLNLHQAWKTCNVRAEGLMHSHGVTQPEAIPLPTTVPMLGGARL